MLIRRIHIHIAIQTKWVRARQRTKWRVYSDISYEILTLNRTKMSAVLTINGCYFVVDTLLLATEISMLATDSLLND